MIYTTAVKRNGMINLDGWSNKKTLRGAIKDLAREIAKINQEEANALTDYMDYTLQIAKEGMANVNGEWYLEVDEANAACREIYLDGNENNDDDDNIEMEYTEANWYLYIRFCA